MMKASALTLTCLLGEDVNDYSGQNEQIIRLVWRDNRVRDQREVDRLAPLHR